MGNQSHQSSTHQPPVPGGDPDQPPSDPKGGPTSDTQGKDKTGYGHIGNKEVPRPDGAPEPHQIF
jgi:hypothetical protein